MPSPHLSSKTWDRSCVQATGQDLLVLYPMIDSCDLSCYHIHFYNLCVSFFQGSSGQPGFTGVPGVPVSIVNYIHI